MYVFLLIILNTILFVSAHCNNNLQNDTLYVSDTIVNFRTIEKVIYIYGFPKKYSSIGFNLGSGYNIYSEIEKTTIKLSNNYYTGINYKIQFKNLHLQSAIIFDRQINKLIFTKNNEQYINSSYLVVDTISWYNVIRNNEVHTVYITKEYERDTTYIEYSDSQITQKNKYSSIYIPVNIGYPIKIKFFNLVPKVGINTNILLFSSNDNKIMIDNNILSEKAYLRTIIFSGNIGVDISYLLTAYSILSFSTNYTYTFGSAYRTNEHTLRKQNFSLLLGISYILNDKS